MKQTNSNSIILAGFTPLLALSLLAVVANPQNKAGRMEPEKKMSCEVLTKATEKILTITEGKYSNAGLHRNQVQERVTNHQAEIDIKIEANRQDTLEKRQALYTKLLEKTETDAEKQAVEDFKQTFEQAVTTRQTIVNTAIETFRANVSSEIDASSQGIDEASQSFKTAVESAVAQAKIDCENGEDVSSIRQSLKTTIENARETFRKTLSDSKVRPDVSTYRQQEKASIEAAHKEFRDTMHQAKETLKAVFSEKLEEEL